MTRTIPAVLVLAAAASFAADIDHDLPIAPAATELRAGYDHGFGTGSYNNDGDKTGSSSSSTATPMAQVKYGVFPELEVEAVLQFTMRNKEASWTGKDASGLKRPELGLKYVPKELGLGVFAVLYVPVGTEDIEGAEPITTLEGGLLYGRTFGQLAVNASASYIFDTESEGLWKQDKLDVFAKGSYEMSGQLAPSLAIDFRKKLEGKYDGKSQTDSDGYLLTLRPGATYAFDDRLQAEASLPFTAVGRNDYAWWGISLAAIWTL